MALNTLKPREVLAAKQGDLSDGGGLTLRVGPTGASWVLRYTAPSGKRREMGLGPARRDTLALASQCLIKARKKAHDARELLYQDIDPLAAREDRKQAAREAEAARKAELSRDHWTLARCARDYHTRIVEPNRKPKHAAQWITSLENHVPPKLWHGPIEGITAPQLLEALQGAMLHERARNSGDLGETLRRVRQRLDCVFEDAMFFGRCAANPASAIKRKLSLVRPKKSGAFAALPFAEVPAFMARLRTMPGIAARCLEFLTLTASRTGEAIGAEWSEFDMQAGVWTIPGARMKRGEPHLVHLSPRVLAIVQAQAGQDSRYVFPSGQPGREGRPQSNGALLAVLDRLGVRERTTVHGLRASFSTWSNETGAARPDVIEACLAHREADRIRASYNRAHFAAERRALLEAWADYCTKPALTLAAWSHNRIAASRLIPEHPLPRGLARRLPHRAREGAYG